MAITTSIPLSTSELVASFAILGLVYGFARIVYNIFFHPLASYPGPKLAAAHDFWYAVQWTSGNWPQTMRKLHDQYGDVVRVAPNELSFASAQSFKDMHGHASKGRKPLRKGPSYDRPTKYPSVLHSEGEDHRKQRKALAHAFSSQALRDQEDIVKKYVDMFASQLGKWSKARPEGVNITEAFNWVTFDIIGELAFGESFKATETGKTHPWISIVIDTVYANSVISLRKRLPALKLLLPFLVPSDLDDKLAYHRQKTKEMTAARIANQENITRADFFQRILEKNEFPLERLEENASILIIAGSETTATTLAGATYYLSRHTDCMKKLQAEIRGAFSSPDEITGDATQRLPYLQACMEEVMRIYPPVAPGLQRISHGASIDGHWVPEGALCSTQIWSLMRDSRYWKDPNVFRPERWLNGDIINKDAFNPFSQGPRVCIGINLAYLELRMILARMVWQYDWELTSKDLDWERDNMMYVLWQKPEMNVKYHLREGLEM